MWITQRIKMKCSGASIAAAGIFVGFIVQTGGFFCTTSGAPRDTGVRRVANCGGIRSWGVITHERTLGGRGGQALSAQRRRRPRRVDEFYEDYDDTYNDDLYNPSDDLESYRSPAFEERKKPRTPLLPVNLSKALVAGVFVLGIGTGVTVDSAINTNPKDLASRDAIDRNAPNPNICQTYGSSAMVVDQRVFVTFNPFSLHVTQADTKPGCVLRAANVVEVLQEKRGLLTKEEVETCKSGMNTWGYVGDLNDHPQLSCVYQSDDAQNEFLSNPKYGLGEDVYDDDRAAATKKSAGSEPANGPRVMSNTVRAASTDRSAM